MKAYIQFVGQSSPEGPPTLVVHYDTQRYMFNCREGTQRLCVQEKVRLGKLSNIFLTRLSWDCIGGLPGMLLTLSDAGIRDISLHGGKNLSHFMAATRQFVYRTSTTLQLNEYESASTYKDKNLAVTPVIVLPNNYTKEETLGEVAAVEVGTKRKHEGDDENDSQTYSRKVVAQMFTDSSGSNNKKKAGMATKKTAATASPPEQTIDAECTPRHPLGGGNTEKRPNNNNQRDFLSKALPNTSPYPAAMSYICEGTSVPRKFNKAAAVALGIKPGPVYGQLQKGISVTLEDGRVITQDMVCEPEIPGHVFMVVDCPSVSYIDGLIQTRAFERFQNDRPKAMIHIVGDDVLEDERYKEWLAKFGRTTDHIFGTNQVCAQTVQYTSHALGQVKLSKLNENIFPIPKYNNTPERAIETVNGLPEKSFPLSNMALYHLEPRNGYEPNNRHLFNHLNTDAPAIRAIEENTEYLQAVELAKAAAANVDVSAEFPGQDVEVITLGTGSSIPAKYRNVSATLVKIPGYGSVMLDAGEGTFGQMMRLFGNQLDEELNALKCIFVSHLHADHHLGVVQLIRKWHQLANRKDDFITVVAPFIYKNWLKEYGQVECLGERDAIKFIRNENIMPHRETRDHDLKNLEVLKDTLGLAELQTVDVIHCRWAYGLTIKHASGWKLVYSGDTRPCEKLVEAGKDATLLIHEATLEDAKMAEAIAKRHTTTGEAIDVGKRMNARFTLLNHFSQRYPKLPNLSKEQNNVCFSFDMMTVPIKQIPVLPQFNPALQLAFKEEEEQVESTD
ncbi:hypothetical protein K501DRAFT_219648 [Backusella circina FSU 941]|nr:hypothetical protein K501DRAFT_219648 [Backusella circina FSU 941]